MDTNVGLLKLLIWSTRRHTFSVKVGFFSDVGCIFSASRKLKRWKQKCGNRIAAEYSLGKRVGFSYVNVGIKSTRFHQITTIGLFGFRIVFENVRIVSDLKKIIY